MAQHLLTPFSLLLVTLFTQNKLFTLTRDFLSHNLSAGNINETLHYSCDMLLFLWPLKGEYLYYAA